MTNFKHSSYMKTWSDIKKEAEVAYKALQFSLASQKYEEAFKCLCKSVGSGTEEVPMNLEAAKLVSNASLMNLKLYEASGCHDVVYLQKAENFAMQSRQQDPSWPKSYFRLSQIYFHEKSESGELKAVLSMMDFMSDSSEADKMTEVIISHLVKLNYFAQKAVMKKSLSWHLVKFPDNVFSIDANGAGHFRSLREFLAVLSMGIRLRHKDGISVLVQPGIYYGINYIIGSTIDIVGDCGAKIDEKTGAIKDDPPIVFQNVQNKENNQLAAISGQRVFQSCTFYVQQDSKVWFSRISIREIIKQHPIHCVCIVESHVNLNQCSVHSICSASISSVDSNVTMKSCRSVGSFGALLTGGPTAVSKVENCYIRGTVGMAIEVRENSRLIELTNSTIVQCSKQGLAVGSGSKKAIVKGCLFEGNCIKLTSNEGAIQLRCCDFAYISETEFKEHKGIGIVIEGGSGKFENIKVSKCFNGFLVQAPVNISSCSLSSCMIGVNICQHISGDVILTNNSIKKCQYEIARLIDSPNPIFRGSNKHKVFVLNINHAASLFLKQAQHQRRQLRRETEDLGAVGDVLGVNPIKKNTCDNCTMSEGMLGWKFKACSGCKTALYCSEKCQQDNWDYHEPCCTTLQSKMKEKISSKKLLKLAAEELSAGFSELNTTEQSKCNVAPTSANRCCSEQEVSKNGSSSNDITPKEESQNLATWKKKNTNKKKKKKSRNF